jgi:predicted transposase YdaD
MINTSRLSVWKHGYPDLLTVFLSRSIWREAKAENTRAIALNFLKEGVSVEAVVRATGLSLEQIQQLQQPLNESGQTQS